MLLIVDDDPAFLAQAERLLDRGRGVFMAGDGQQAKELIRAVGAAFSAVLVDLNLPGQDGFSLIRELREAFPDLPVIAISGVCSRAALDSARIIGAADALPKPIDHTWKAAIARALLQ
jgi:two-component system response regulator TctD